MSVCILVCVYFTLPFFHPFVSRCYDSTFVLLSLVVSFVIPFVSCGYEATLALHPLEYRLERPVINEWV